MVTKRPKLPLKEALRLFTKYTAFHVETLERKKPIDDLAAFLIKSNPGVDGFTTEEKKDERISGCKCPTCAPHLYEGHNLDFLRLLAKNRKGD